MGSGYGGATGNCTVKTARDRMAGRPWPVVEKRGAIDARRNRRNPGDAGAPAPDGRKKADFRTGCHNSARGRRKRRRSSAPVAAQAPLKVDRNKHLKQLDKIHAD